MTSIHFILCNKTDFLFPTFPLFQFQLLTWLQLHSEFSISIVYIFIKWNGERAREKEKESNIKIQGWHVSSKNEKSFDMLLICIHWHTHTHKMCTSQMPSIPLDFNIKAFLLKYSLFLFLLLKMDCNLFIFFSFALLSNVNPMFESTLEFLQNSKRFRI